MIIQCDHCSAKFRMDDSKLAKGPVKVRCAKCKEVFVVQKEEPAVESPLSAQPESLPSAGLSADTAGFSFDTLGKTEDPFSQSPTDFSFDSGSQPVANEAVSAQADSSDEFDWQGTSSAPAVSGAGSSFDLSAFDDSIAAPSAADMSTAAADDGFNFGDVDVAVERTPSAEIPPVAADSQGDDFEMDFGDISFSGQESGAGVAADSSAVSPAEEFTLSAAVLPQSAQSSDDFVLSFNTDTVKLSPTPSTAAEEPENVNFGEFSFGEMDDSTVAESSIPAAAQVELPRGEIDLPESPLDYGEEVLPPLSLTSRKKSSSLFPLLVILGAIVLIIATAGSGVYFFGGTKAFTKVGLGFLVDWYGDKGVDDGSITLKGVTASYTVNSAAGELFVVRGEAVNNFKKPRASIQVKVSIIGAGGAALVSKSAFCGNSLSNEQLASLPLAKIEETMNNQFGDSLANLGLKPGGTIPFVIVVSQVPKDATDYTVQVVGSTVATQ